MTCSATPSPTPASPTKPIELRFESEILLQHFPYTAPAFQIDPAAEVYPFQYPADDMPDLMPSIMRRYPDADNALEQWVKQFYEGTPVGTLKLLSAMTHAIKAQFSYRAREQMGTQMPAETIASGSGTCRDYALLMIEALRTLGFASRFVSGYLYDAAADVSPNGMVGGAATHAWVQVYVPGRGLDGVRPDQRDHRRREPDPHRRHPLAVAVDPGAGHLRRAEQRLHRHGCRRPGRPGRRGCPLTAAPPRPPARAA